MTRKQARKYVEQVETAKRLYHCEHGHLDCALERNGPCADEVMSQLEDEEVIP